ncbi:MAG: hypothetical protein Q7S01_00580 [bacterium]|nr:hypothetical protein [bacterium]
MMKKIIHFIQYHNFFTIAVMVVFMGASVSFAASSDVRQSVLAQTEVARSVDNSYIVNTDFDSYDMGLKIQSVTEDADNYYVGYAYDNVTVVDYVWQPVSTAESMKVSKKELSGRDLGLYVAGQLGQIIDQQLAYLKEVQKKEKKNGATQKVLATEYSGLVGQFLSTEEKTFDGYAPVVTEPIAQQQEQVASVAESQDAQDADPLNTVAGQDSPTPAPATSSQTSLTREEVEKLISDRVAELLAQGNISTQTPEETATETATSATTEPTAPVETPAPAETAPAPAPEPVVEPTPDNATAPEESAPAEATPASETEPTPVANESTPAETAPAPAEVSAPPAETPAPAPDAPPPAATETPSQ